MDTIVINKNEDLSEILTHHNAGKMEMYLLQKKPQKWSQRLEIGCSEMTNTITSVSKDNLLILWK